VAVEPRVLELIHYLLVNRDRAVDKGELAEQLWPGRFISDTVISQTVRKARAAVGDDGNRQAVICTVRGYGYRFVADPEPVEGSAQDAPIPVPHRRGPAMLLLAVLALARGPACVHVEAFIAFAMLALLIAAISYFFPQAPPEQEPTKANSCNPTS